MIEFQTAARDERVKVATFLQENKDTVQMLTQQTAKHPLSQHPIKIGRYDVTFAGLIAELGDYTALNDLASSR